MIGRIGCRYGSNPFIKIDYFEKVNYIIWLFFWLCLTYCCSASLKTGFQSWVDDPRFSLFPGVPIVAPRSANVACRTYSQQFIAELKNKTLWTMQMWDASAKVPVGVLSGTVYQLGNFDECLRLVEPLKTQFCLAEIRAKVPGLQHAENERAKSAWTVLSESRNDPGKVPKDVLSLGLCIPADCTSADLQTAIKDHLATFGTDVQNETSFHVTVKDEFCTRNDRLKLSLNEMAFWIFIISLVVLTILATLLDVLLKKNSKDTHIFCLLTFFSIPRNVQSIFPKGKKERHFLDILHGIKYLSIAVVVMGHRIGIGFSVSATNFDYVEGNLIEEQKMFFLQSDLVVDTFFFISGLVASFTLMTINTRRVVNPFQAVLVRLFRLVPLYFLVIWYQSVAAFRLGSGPLWNSFGKSEAAYCVKNWWTNVLFISNYVNTEEMCLPHSWFLPCELHFFTVTAFLIPIMVKHPKIGRALLAVIISASAVIPAIVIFLHKLQPLVLFYYDFLSQPRQSVPFNVLYIKSHNRAAVYFIGTATGYFLHETKYHKKQLPRKTALLGCFIWLALMFAPMAYGSLYYDPKYRYNVVEATFFGLFRRVLWGLGFAVLMLTHRFATIPFADAVLGSRITIFLSRMSYGTYILHYNFIFTEILSKRTLTEFSIQKAIVESIGDLVKSGFVTLILLFIFEMPLKGLLTNFFFKKKLKSFNEQQKDSEITIQRIRIQNATRL